MGVAKYKLSPKLPAKLREELPTAEEFSRELPHIGLIRLRIEIERMLRDYLAERGIKVDRPMGVVQMLRTLAENGFPQAGSERLMAALSPMNQVHHGIDVGEETAREAMEAGNEFLATLKSMRKQ
jgi:hypothetical protein